MKLWPRRHRTDAATPADRVAREKAHERLDEAERRLDLLAVRAKLIERRS